MTKTDMESAVDQHACTVDGRLHRFKFQWAAGEARWASSGARYLLAVNVLPDGASLDPAPTIYVMMPISISREQLLALVDEALKKYLRTRPESFVAVSPSASATLVSA